MPSGRVTCLFWDLAIFLPGPNQTCAKLRLKWWCSAVQWGRRALGCHLSLEEVSEFLGQREGGTHLSIIPSVLFPAMASGANTGHLTIPVSPLPLHIARTQLQASRHHSVRGAVHLHFQSNPARRMLRTFSKHLGANAFYSTISRPHHALHTSPARGRYARVKSTISA